MGMSVISSIALTGFLYVFGETVFRIFTSDAAVLAKGMEILYFLVPTFITYVAIEIYSGALRGVGDCWIPMILTCLGICVLRVVWILVAVPFHPTIKTIIFSYPLTWAVTSVLFILYFHRFSRLKN